MNKAGRLFASAFTVLCISAVIFMLILNPAYPLNYIQMRGLYELYPAQTSEQLSGDYDLLQTWKTIRVRFTENSPDAVKMQNQSFSHEGRRHEFYMWTAVCDERMKVVNGKTALIFFVTFNAKMKTLENKDKASNITGNWKCVFKLQGGGLFESPLAFIFEIAINNQYKTIACVLTDSECPVEASIFTDDKTSVTNKVYVHRQPSPRGGIKRGIGLCVHGPLALPISAFHTWHRLIEWFEYQKSAKFTKVIMPTPVRSEMFPLPVHVQKTLDYYQSTGFLEIFDATYHEKKRDLSDAKSTYSYMESAHFWHQTFCYIKYSRMFTHIMVQDLDEIVAFDTTRCRSISQALEEVMHTLKLPSAAAGDASFTFSDKRFLEDCSNMVRVNRAGEVGRILGNNSALMSFISAWPGEHMGKTMHSTKWCLTMFTHYCNTGLIDVGYYNESRFQFLTVKYGMALPSYRVNTELMLLAHYTATRMKNDKCLREHKNITWVADKATDMIHNIEMVATEIGFV